MTEITSTTTVQTTGVTDEAEMAVLGAVLLSGTVALPAIVEEGVRTEDFRVHARATIFALMTDMYKAGIPIDRLTLTDCLRSADLLEQVGGRECVDTLASVVPNVGNLRRYAQIVVRSSLWRHRAQTMLAASEAVLAENEEAYRRVLGRMRECELRFRPLLERDLATP